MLSSVHDSGYLGSALMAEPCVKEDGGMKNKLSDSIGKKHF